MRLAFMGSPPFADQVLASLVASDHEVAVVVTRPDRPLGRGRRVQASSLAVLAHAHGIPLLQPATARDPSFVAQMRSFECELLLVASYGEILKRELLELTPRGPFNVHASLLPRHRGASPIQAAILCGDEETGVSIQRMVAALDEGDVVLSERTRILPEETASALTLRLSHLGGTAAVKALDRIAKGEAVFTPQDPALATYSKKIRKEDGTVDWSKDRASLARFVRAMTDWPGARATLDEVGDSASGHSGAGREVALLAVRPIEGAQDGTGQLGATARPIESAGGDASELGAAGERERGGAAREELADRTQRTLVPKLDDERLQRPRGTTANDMASFSTTSRDVAAPQRPGRILDARDRLLVETGDGVIEILSIKPAGKPPMSGGAFLRGARLAAGSRFRC